MSFSGPYFLICYSKSFKASIHTCMHSEVPVVWGSLRLAPITFLRDIANVTKFLLGIRLAKYVPISPVSPLPHTELTN